MVVGGNMEKLGEHYGRTDVPLPFLATFHILLAPLSALSLCIYWHLQAIDVHMAFLGALLPHAVYSYHPKGWDLPPGRELMLGAAFLPEPLSYFSLPFLLLRPAKILSTSSLCCQLDDIPGL